MPPREIPRHSASAAYIMHLKLGGGDRHRLAICAIAIVAAKNGFRIERMDEYHTGQEGSEIPDLVIKRTERMLEGPRRWSETMRYRVEVVDTHDPVPDWKPGKDGFDDCVKVQLVRGDDYCWKGHGKNPNSVVGQGGDENPHSLCIEGLFWLCERSLP